MKSVGLVKQLIPPLESFARCLSLKLLPFSGGHSIVTRFSGVTKPEIVHFIAGSDVGRTSIARDHLVLEMAPPLPFRPDLLV
jgi:hypothetical protein